MCGGLQMAKNNSLMSLGTKFTVDGTFQGHSQAKHVVSGSLLGLVSCYNS